MIKRKCVQWWAACGSSRTSKEHMEVKSLRKLNTQRTESLHFRARPPVPKTFTHHTESRSSFHVFKGYKPKRVRHRYKSNQVKHAVMWDRIKWLRKPCGNACIMSSPNLFLLVVPAFVAQRSCWLQSGSASRGSRFIRVAYDG